MKVMVRRSGFYFCFLADWLCDFGLVPNFVSVSLALMMYDEWPSWSVCYNIVHCLKSGKCVINIFWVTHLVLILYIGELMILEFEWELRLKSRYTRAFKFGKIFCSMFTKGIDVLKLSSLK